MLSRMMVAGIVVLLAAVAALGQNPGPPPVGTEQTKQKTADLEQGRRDPELPIPEEMRTRLLIERAEDEHRKLLADVRQLGDLSSDLAKSYSERSQLTPDDLKRLSTIEKLAKRVLSKALGKEEKVDLPGEISVADAIDQLNSAAQRIRKVVNTETRYVVSAAVIGNSNEVISLAERIRELQKH